MSRIRSDERVEPVEMVQLSDPNPHDISLHWLVHRDLFKWLINLVIHGIFTISTGAGFCPSTVGIFFKWLIIIPI